MWISGAATSVFGELWHTSPRDLARSVVGAALEDAHIDKKEIQALFVGNMLSGILGGQEHLGALFADELGLTCAAYKIEGACASGGLAVHAAYMALASGQYDTVLVLGIEKMTDHAPEDVARALMGAGSSEERLSGITFPGLYALMARLHMHEFGTTEEELAAVAVKNHHHAALNPNAQFHREITIEQVLASGMVADPLKLLDCSPISDGAAALVLANKHKNSSVQIKASAVATDTLSLTGRRTNVSLGATMVAANQAYEKSGITPHDVDVAEVHDCFTIAEIFAMEDLGFFVRGEAARAVARGKTRFESADRLVVNPSGGLKGCGHPIGATGVKQIVELTDQLRGRAGARQVAHPRVGLAQNVGGSGATAVVHILASEAIV